MILVCPSCDAKFKVPDGAITAGGRKVRCAKCQHSWHATPGNALKSPSKPSALKVAAQPAQRELPAQQPQKVAAPKSAEDHAPQSVSAPQQADLAPTDITDSPSAIEVTADDEFDPVEEENYAHDDFDGSDLPGDLDEFEEEAERDADDLWQDVGVRRRLSERSRLKWTRRLIMAGWVALLLLILTIFGLLIFNKEGVTKAFPATHQIYDFFSSAGSDAIDKYRPDEGEPVSTPLGEIDVYVSADLYTNLTRFEEIDGKNQLAVRGFVENTGSRAAHVPQVQIFIKDRNGNILDQWLHEPVGLVLRRGQQLQFETFRYPVPSGMASVEVKALEGTRSNTEAAAR